MSKGSKANEANQLFFKGLKLLVKTQLEQKDQEFNTGEKIIEQAI